MELEEIWKGLHPQCLEMAEISQLESQCWSGSVCVRHVSSSLCWSRPRCRHPVACSQQARAWWYPHPHSVLTAVMPLSQGRTRGASHVGDLYYFCPAGKVQRLSLVAGLCVPLCKCPLWPWPDSLTLCASLLICKMRTAVATLHGDTAGF